MILERFYDERLAQASYLVGCAATGEALVIDPARETRPYLAAARKHGLNISHITETHIHADFLSGSRELRANTGAQLLLSGEGGADWRYAYAAQDRASLLRDGDQFMVGNVKVEVLHTPGHTPEHLSFMITDTAATQLPMGIFTGDFIFVGDVGRPDLLEKAAKVEGTMEQSARTLFDSLERTQHLPGHLQIWPGHGAGSACGKALGAIPSTTLGYERAVNWAFQLDKGAFVQEVLAGQPEPPAYFAEMKKLNRDGPSILSGSNQDAALPADELARVLEKGLTVIDSRPWNDFKRAHTPGAINIPVAERSFTTWAGWLVPYDRPFYLVVDPADASTSVADVRQALQAIGLDQCAGYFESTAAINAASGAVGAVSEITVAELASAPEAYAVIDVRGQSEWDGGHLPHARHIPLGYLRHHHERLPHDRPVVVQCETGVRSAVAAGVLKAIGFQGVLNLVGGIAEWKRLGHEVVTGAVA